MGPHNSQSKGSKKFLKSKFIGLFLIAVSILMSLLNLSITGNIIGPSSNPTIWIAQLVSFILGLLILALQSPIRQGSKSIEDILTRGFSDGTKNLVLDSSFLILYDGDPNDLSRNGGNVEIYAPSSVLKEVSGRRGKSVLMKELEKGGLLSQVHQNIERYKKEDPEEYKFERRMAMKALFDTTKHRTFKKLRPYFEGSIEDKEDFERDNSRLINKIKRETGRKYSGLEGNESCLKYIKNTYRVSEGDIDVLTTALLSISESTGDEKTKIIAQDSHLKEAVENLRKSNPAYGKRIIYEDGFRQAG